MTIETSARQVCSGASVTHMWQRAHGVVVRGGQRLCEEVCDMLKRRCETIIILLMLVMIIQALGV